MMRWLCLALGLTLSGRCLSGPVPVRVVESDQGFELLRGDQPYFVQGAGVAGGSLEHLSKAGANSVRTWSTRHAESILDRAESLGLSVALGLEIGLERHGFDYDDPASVEAQFSRVRDEVIRYKDHPALLFWIIGNEPNLNYSNPRVFDAINEISRMIHGIDGAHPTTTALAGFDPNLAMQVDLRAADLDFLSIQLYGGLSRLPEMLEETGFKRPVMITEWGATGHWEVPSTAWGAPIEPTSSMKADSYLSRYREVIEKNRDRMMGSYVFYWGQKQERTPTWYGMFLADGSATEAVDVMEHLWRGSWSQHRSPRVLGMTLANSAAKDNISLAAGRRYSAVMKVDPVPGAELEFRWEVLIESTATQEGGDPEEVPPMVSGLIEGGDSGEVTLRAPTQPGAYRLFAYVYGPGGRAGHANIPFRVEPSDQ